MWGTVSSGKQGRGTAHPKKPLAEHGAICFWKCQNENHFRNGKLLLNPLTFPIILVSLYSNVWICLVSKAGTELRKDGKDGLGCCHTDKRFVPNTPKEMA